MKICYNKKVEKEKYIKTKIEFRNIARAVSYSLHYNKRKKAINARVTISLIDRCEYYLTGENYEKNV